MSWRKRDLVEAAFEEVGLAAYSFELQPEQLQSALRRMDAMVAEWVERGLQIGYNATGDIDADSGIALSANAAVYLQLALRISPSLGKIPAPETKAAASAAMDTLYIAAAQPLQRQQPGDMPRGEGQKPWRSIYTPFMPAPTDQSVVAAKTDALDLAKD